MKGRERVTELMCMSVRYVNERDIGTVDVCRICEWKRERDRVDVCMLCERKKQIEGQSGLVCVQVM